MISNLIINTNTYNKNKKNKKNKQKTINNENNENNNINNNINYVKIEGDKIKHYSNIIEYLLDKSIPKNNRIKINKNDFYILKYNEYDNLLKHDYSVEQIKKICKFYKIKISGNKDELYKRCYNFIYYSYYSIYIQKIYRKIIIKNFIYLHGPGFYNKQLCVNDTDFFTLDNITSIPYTQFFSIKDADNFIYAFDIMSLYNLYIKNNNNLTNPFSTKPFMLSVYSNMIKFIEYSKILKLDIDINISDDIINTTESKKMQMKILNLFQTMDSLGNYTNLSWYTSLSRYNIIRFIRELNDIWNYRANLSNETKREICPPHGSPFRNINVNINNIALYSTPVINKYAINLIEQFINKGIDDASRSLGCYYVLASLTLVNQSAAEALPWLYQSVQYN